MRALPWGLLVALAGACGQVSSVSAKPPTPQTKKEPSMTQSLARGGMSVSWSVDGESLLVTMRAPTTGWVGVGFNTQPTLDGSLLILGAVESGAVRVEEHIAQPPNHPTRVSLGGTSALRRFEATEENGETQVSFVLDLARQDGVAPRLSAGASVFLTLAFSQEDDFQHHSMMRTSAMIAL